MKNKLTLSLLFLFALLSCGQNNQSKTVVKTNQTELYSTNKIQIASIEANKVLKTPTLRYQHNWNGYEFNLPINYRIRFIPKFENTETNYYKFQWKINDSFSIDSESKDFKRFLVSNFIPYIPQSSNEEGEIYIVSNTNSDRLKTSDFLKKSDEVFYKDENSAIFKQHGEIRAFYFEYLTDTQEYLIYLSDTPFFNINPEPKLVDKVNQLLNQLRLAKNISNQTVKQKNEWTLLSKQLSTLEKNFLDKIVSETKKSLENDLKLQSYGNIKYFTVFKENSDIDIVWKKLKTVNNSKILTISEVDTEFEYLHKNDFRYFYNSDYIQINKSKNSIIYKRESSESYCLITKPKNSDVIIFKVISSEYYKNEIEFYRILFENYEKL